MGSNNGINLRFVKGEIFLYTIIILLVILIPLSNVFTNAKLNETNIVLEELNSKIEKQEAINESLSMQINELASLENIQKIAEEYNLTYANSNILNLPIK